MGILALGADERVAEVSFTDSALSVSLKDGRTISVPLTWYPRLLDATPEQRMNWKIDGSELPVIEHVSMTHSNSIRVITKDFTGRGDSDCVAADCAGRIETGKLAFLGHLKTMESTIHA